jgi:hypothetical protein
LTRTKAEEVEVNLKSAHPLMLLVVLMTPSVMVAQLPSCQDEFRNPWDKFKNQGEFIAAVKRAEPGSNLYVPSPFPRTNSQVLENFRYAYGRIWADETRVPEDELDLFREFKSHQLAFTIQQVENWSPHRCNALRPQDFFHVVRAFSASGPELARFVFHPSGLLSRYVTIPADASGKQLRTVEFPTVDGASELARGRLHVEITDVQIVHTFTRGLSCDVLAPCVVLRSGATHYLLEQKGREEFYVLSATAKRIPLEEGRGDLQSLVSSSEETLMTVGDQWLPIRRVPGS